MAENIQGKNPEGSTAAHTNPVLIAGKDAAGNIVDLLLDVDGTLHVNGAITLAGSNAKQPFSGSTTVTHTFTVPMTGFVISNDGISDLTFTIAGDTYTVKAGEVFDDNFASFTVVTVTTTVAFRAWGRG